MSDQNMEMQFANPDWQPTSARPGDESQGYQAMPSEKPTTTRVWTPGRGQTPRWTSKASSEAGQSQRQRRAPVRVRSRRGGQLIALFIRVALLVIWFTTPLLTRAFHGGWFLPLLGLLFLPLTTLTYTIVFALAGSVTGLGWLWIAAALLLDLVSYGGQARVSRDDPEEEFD